MSQLSPHFTEAELRVDGEEDRIILNARWLCVNILEPIRAKFGPISVTSGYRNPKRNASAGGKSASFHLFEEDKCAADIVTMAAGLTQSFNWIRLESGLPFDKVILEYRPGTMIPACIHLQGYREKQPRRQAFIGETGDAKSYKQVEVK